MSDNDFLDIIKESFEKYLQAGARSTQKLKPLHGGIAQDLANVLGTDYEIVSQGYKDPRAKKGDHEEKVSGKYYNKYVDITVLRDKQAVAGYSVKFVMSNYKQNANNYFEEMLGETANLRANSFLYFQIYIIFDEIPYFSNSGKIAKYEPISKDNLMKYVNLSGDSPGAYAHVPDKTLICIVNLKRPTDDSNKDAIKDKKSYSKYYKNHITDNDLISYSNAIKDVFGNSVILNHYQDFINRSCKLIEGKAKS